MDNFLIALAFVAQLSDAALTCRTLAKPGGYEANPILPQSCAGVVGYKAASLAAIPLTRGKWRTAITIANLGAGTAGVSFTLAWR